MGGFGHVVSETPRARTHALLAVPRRLLLGHRRPLQNFAAKYIGIGRGISSRIQSALGIGMGRAGLCEFSGLSPSGKALIITGSLVMIGAVSISMADPGASELVNWSGP